MAPVMGRFLRHCRDGPQILTSPKLVVAMAQRSCGSGAVDVAAPAALGPRRSLPNPVAACIVWVSLLCRSGTMQPQHSTPARS